MSQKIKTSVEIDGSLTASQIANATTDTDKFLVSDGGTVKYRTGAELASDLGIASGSTSKVQHQVKAGVAINKGQAVYVTSADGTNMIVGLASNASEATSSKTMGLLNATVVANGFADVITEGLLDGLDTSTAAVGNPVWLGTGGNLIYGLANKPYAPNHLVFIGIVTRVNANNGEIFVKVQNGFELDEIHDVDLKTTAKINGHLLGYNGSLWVNKTISEWLGYTPYNASNPAGYISSYTETDTLASVTARGALTSGNIFTPTNGGLFFNGNGLYNTGVYSSNNDLWFNAGSTQKAALNSSGDFTANNSLRSPIFYDSDNTAYYVNPASATRLNGYLSFGVPGNGANANGRWLSIEGNTDVDGEGSGRIFFTEHNSTTAAMDAYGLSIGYRGGATSLTTAGGNTWTGLSAIDNGAWGFWGHNGDNTGTLAMFGPRTGEYITATGSFRAPIFYDSNDTSYYTNPASTSVLSSIVLRGASAISFYGAGSGTYNIGSIYSSTSINSWEAPLETDSYTAARVPFILTWRGGYAAKGGLKLTGDASGELGGNVILHAGNYSSYAVPTSRTITINGTSYDLSANRSWTVTANAVETDTLATVTARGASTSTLSTFDGGLNIGSAKLRWGGATTPTLGLPFSGSTNAFWIDVNDGDTGGLMVDNEGVTVYGAGDNGYVFRVIDEDVYQATTNVAASTTFQVSQGQNGGGFIKGNFDISGYTTIGGSAYLSSGNSLFFDSGVTNDYSIRKNGTALQFDSGGDFTFNKGVNILTTRDNALVLRAMDGGTNPWNYIEYVNSVGTRKYYVGTDTSNVFNIYSDDGTGYVGSNTSFRSPIFYDSNNTGYYVDPASTSSLNVLSMANKIIVGSFPNSTVNNGEAWIGRAADRSAGTMTVQLGGNLDRKFEVVDYGWTTVNFSVNGYGAAEASGSMRAPIFYDSNDTSYYLDPNSTSRLLAVNAPSGFTSVGNPWGTANSAYFPNGITTAGSDNWIYGHTYVGNAPANGAGHEFWSTGKEYHRSNEATNGHGASGRWLSIQSANGNFIPYSFESEYGNHSWGTVARFRINQSGADRPSIQFSNASNDTRWNIGYCYADDNFRIVQNMGYRNDNSTSDGWGTQRLLLDTAGNFYSDGLYQSNASLRSPIYYDSNNTGYYIDAASTSNLNALTVGGSGVLTYGNAPRAANSYVMFYEGFTLNANDMSTNSTGFTYSNNAPWTGPVARFSTGGGYDLWLNASYGGNGTGLSYRTRNGDAGTYNSWHRIYSDSYRPYADDSGTTGQRSFNYLYASSYLESGGAVYGTIFYDNNNRGYYMDPDGTSQLSSIYTNNWVRVQGDSGVYSQDYGGHLRRPVNASHGTWEIYGYNKNGYAGMNVYDPQGYNNNYMHESGNGGLYQQNGNGWIFYHSRGNACLGIMTSATSSSYKLYVGGSIYAEGDVVAYSDRRKKENIVTVDNALETVNKLRGVYYNRIDDDSKKRQVGVIAQEIQEVLPEVVTYAKDIDEYGVSYGNITGLLIEAIKEQQTQIKELKELLNNLINK